MPNSFAARACVKSRSAISSLSRIASCTRSRRSSASGKSRSTSTSPLPASTVSVSVLTPGITYPPSALVDGAGGLGLPHLHPDHPHPLLSGEPPLDLLEDVLGEELGRGVALVERRDLVDHLVVEGADDLLHHRLEVGEVEHHAQGVELARLEVHPHPVVVPVQVLAPAGVPPDGVRGGEGEVLEDR